MKKRETVNFILHVTVGAALAAAVMWHPPLIIAVTFVYALLREKAQHRYILTVRDEAGKWSTLNLYTIEKRTFFDFGWMTTSRMLEVAQWVAGAIVATLLMHFFG